METKLESEAAEVVDLLPTEPGDEVFREAERRGLLGGNVIVYKVSYMYDPLESRRREAVECHCTACGETFYLDKANASCGCRGQGSEVGFIDPASDEPKYHGDRCTCPWCGETCKATHTRHFGNRPTFEITNHFVLTVHSVHGHTCLLTWILMRNVDKEGNVMNEARKWEGFISVSGKLFRASGNQRNIGGGYIWYPRWRLRKRLFDRCEKYAAAEIMPFDPADITGTDCEKSALEEYLISGCDSGIYPFTYLRLWSRHRNVENLVRSGCSQYVTAVIDECMVADRYTYYGLIDRFEMLKTKRFINWKAVRPHEMLGLRKDKMHIAREGTPYDVMLCRLASERGTTVTPEHISAMHRIGGRQLCGIMDRELYDGRFAPNIIRTVNYLSKRPDGSIYDDITLLRDYWKMIVNINGSVPPELEFPRDLERAHDDAVLKVKEIENKAISKKIEARIEELQPMEFTDEALGLTICAPRSHAEFIKEGRLLHHCVAGYAAAHSERKTTILFVRKISNRDRPFFTLEYKNGQVIQNRGSHNCARTPDVEKFETEWLEYMKGATSNGKRNHRSAAEIRPGA